MPSGSGAHLRLRTPRSGSAAAVTSGGNAGRSPGGCLLLISTARKPEGSLQGFCQKPCGEQREKKRRRNTSTGPRTSDTRSSPSSAGPPSLSPSRRQTTGVVIMLFKDPATTEKKASITSLAATTPHQSL